MSVVRARRARDGRCFVTDGWRLGCSGACASDNRETPTTSPASVCATLATDGLACNERGTCVDTPGDYPNFVCLCDDGYLGARCEAAVVTLRNASFVRYVDAPLRAGQYEVFRFDVRCSPMDVEITFKKAANDTNVDTEVQFLLHRSKMAYAGQLGLYTNESVVRGLFPGEDTLNLDVNDIETGMWYLQVIVISGELGSGFELRYELFGSRLARYNEFNDCERDDGALLLTVSSTNGSYTITQPFVFEPDYRDCGDEEQSCYIGDAHSSIRGQGRGAARNGVGPILGGKPVLVMSTPALLETPYFLLVGDSRKFLGVYNASDPYQWFSTDGVKNATLTSSPPRLLAQMMPNATALPFDHEACGNILNRADMIGNVCVVSRGSCVFSMKTLQCQASGAVAAIIIDDEIDTPFAPDNWVNTHLPDIIKIPTLAYNLVDGNRLLAEMFDDANVTVDIRTYQCTPKVHCARCAPGLTSPETNCTSTKCPGMDESFLTNCTGHGKCVRDSNDALICVCDADFTGDACEVLDETTTYAKVDGDVVLIDESHHYRRANRETTITVLAIVLSFFGIAVCATAYQIRRRRQRMTAHIIWKPADSDDEQPPPTVDSRV